VPDATEPLRLVGLSRVPAKPVYREEWTVFVTVSPGCIEKPGWMRLQWIESYLDGVRLNSQQDLQAIVSLLLVLSTTSTSQSRICNRARSWRIDLR
jgi:hypothetical protein